MGSPPLDEVGTAALLVWSLMLLVGSAVLEEDGEGKEEDDEVVEEEEKEVAGAESVEEVGSKDDSGWEEV